MKNFKQIIKALFIGGVFVFAVSCSDKKESEPTTYTEVIETILELPRKDGSGEKETVKVTFTGTFDAEGNWLSREVSENVLRYLELDSQLSFENFVEDKIAEKQMERVLALQTAKLSDTYASDHNHSNCISDCKDKYTDKDGSKIKGRGACKFNCWVETVKEILDDIATIISAVS